MTNLHLLHALDDWSRVRQLQCEDVFQKHGYFPEIRLSEELPLHYLIAPALRFIPRRTLYCSIYRRKCSGN